MNFLYNLSIHTYGGLIALASHFGSKAKKRFKGSRETWKILDSKVDKNERYVWFHASSLGEFEQGLPVMEKLKQEYPQTKILLTFFSPSGYEVRKNYAGADIVCYMPLDTPRNVRRFLSKINIDKAIFIKYEFWGNYLNQLKKQDIPIYLISAIFRKEQVFFKIYGGFYRRLLKLYTHIFVQNESSRKLLKTVDVFKVTIAGDTRFDRVYAISKQAKVLPTIEKFAENSSALVAGSTWSADENLIAEYFNSHSNIKLIIAPHEIHESHLAEIESKLKRPFLRYSQMNESNANTVDCVIIDCFGILSSIYRYGKVAYIGGGFGAGIHNTLEAAVFGVPVLWGPNYQRFNEAHGLIDCGGGFSINDYESLKLILDTAFADKTIGEKSRKYVEENIGATDKIFEKLFQENV